MQRRDEHCQLTGDGPQVSPVDADIVLSCTWTESPSKRPRRQFGTPRKHLLTIMDGVCSPGSGQTWDSRGFGEALHPYPEPLHIVTKVGATRNPHGGFPARDPESLRRSVKEHQVPGPLGGGAPVSRLRTSKG
jgi:hypothetical protein